MSCAETRRLIDAYVDNELDLRAALEVEEHLAGCRSCEAEERSLRNLQAASRAHLTRHAPPPGVEAKLRNVRSPRRWSKWAVLAPAAAAAVLALAVAPRVWRQPVEAAAGDAVIAAHVHSLLASHLTDVASSDQHTVKPWFQGKLDYSLPVTDFAAEGFALAGGRLDYVEGRPTAALVYRRAQHVINVFTRPSKGGDEPLLHVSQRGYSAYGWSGDGMSYWVVSDVNDADLLKLVELLRRRA
jgi:anti-sigma factor RsiW